MVAPRPRVLEGRGESQMRGGEHGRGLITKRAVRPQVVVFISLGSSERSSITDAFEDLHSQALVPETPVEARCVVNLPRTPRLGLEGATAYHFEPAT